MSNSQSKNPHKNLNNLISSKNITDELSSSFRDYSMNVIIGRALPDVRDGLKPVHRRILYAMHSEGLSSDKKFSKCAGVVGEVLKKYHPHGDMSVYDALVRMAQTWNMKEVLIDGQGNFGNIDGDPAAAYRYTEAKLSKISEELLADIKENTVDFLSNFDETTSEPSILPAKFPNLLINGSEGIAVAMATKCPPHNISEVVNAITAIIEERYFNGAIVSNQILNEMVPGPDFPTGGIICGNKGCLEANLTGKGSIIVRGRVKIEIDNKNNQKIIINEIPYQVNKSKLLEKIAILVRQKKITGISDLHDESDRDGMRIVVCIRRDSILDVVLNQLYQHTQLQSYYSTNLLAISNGQPKVFNLRGIISEFISFRKDIITKRTTFRLLKYEKKLHFSCGIIAALSDINRIINIIHKSKNISEARNNLINQKFADVLKVDLFKTNKTPQIKTWIKQGFASLDENQVNSILEMKLSKLVLMERDKIISDCNDFLIQIDELQKILNYNKNLMNIIKTELIEIKDKYGSKRKTTFINDINKLKNEDFMPKETMLITISNQGYMKRSLLSEYKAQHRGGKGKKAVTAKDNDFIVNAFIASTHSYLLIFTDNGKVFWVKVYEISQAGSQSKGRPIINLIKLSKNEKICTVLPVEHFPQLKNKLFIITCTKLGKIKKSDLKLYSKPRKNGLIACKINKDDQLIKASITDGTNNLLLSTKNGMAIRFKESNVRAMNRHTSGVKGISLKKNDNVVSMEVVSDNSSIFTITERGYGKRTSINKYREQSRGGVGTITIKCDCRNGNVADVVQVKATDTIMIITNKGKLIRINVDSISKIGRNTKGVKLISVNKKKNENVISIAKFSEKLIK